MNQDGLTLQINLCAGDVDYAPFTVPALVAAHPHVEERLAIVDCCRPQRTRIFDPSVRSPEPRFSERIERVRALAQRFRDGGLFDRVEFLLPKSPLFRAFAAKFVRPWMEETHDYGGCAFMPYWAAIELPRTRHVIHYDADMLLHQDAGVDWAAGALKHMNIAPSIVAASPRISPPWTDDPGEDAPSRHEGRPLAPTEGGWLNDWFSTRCFLLDRERLASELPLVRGLQAFQYRLRRAVDRGYPPGPEHLLHHALGRRGRHCLHLSSRRAWLLHPTHKSTAYLEMLPELLASVQRGVVPAAQRGYADIRLDAWRNPNLVGDSG